MKEAHGRPVMAGRRGEVPAESGYSPQASPAPSPSYHSRSAGAPAGHTPTALPRGNSHEALIDNLEGRLKRLSSQFSLPIPPLALLSALACSHSSERVLSKQNSHSTSSLCAHQQVSSLLLTFPSFCLLIFCLRPSSCL
jgi:hypothetical protein